MSSEDLSGDSPGAVLAQARRTSGVSQREVADALHLPLHVVDAVERGDKTRLPSYVFTRGYVRAYAKLLELDPDPLVTALTMSYGGGLEVDAQEADDVVSIEAKSWQLPDVSLRLKFGLWTGVIVLVVGAIVISLLLNDPAQVSASPSIIVSPSSGVKSPSSVVEPGVAGLNNTGERGDAILTRLAQSGGNAGVGVDSQVVVDPSQDSIYSCCLGRLLGGNNQWRGQGSVWRFRHGGANITNVWRWTI